MSSSRQRQSGGSSVRRSEAPSSRQSVAPRATPAPSAHAPKLPPYQEPFAPLNDDARTKLMGLADSAHSLRKLQESIDRATKFLERSAGNVNSQWYERKENLLNRKRKRDQAPRDGPNGTEHEEEDIRGMERSVEEYDTKVQDMTKGLDAALRQTIDGYAGSRNIESALKGLARTSHAASAAFGQFAESQQAQQRTQQSQRSRQHQRLDNDDPHGSADESEGDVTQIPDANTGSSQHEQPPPPAVPRLPKAFADSLQQENDRYNVQRPTTKYASHNAYRSFKEVVHYERDPDGGAPPLGNAQTWFAEEEGRAGPANGVTAVDDDEDDDIAVARVKISTRCPITLVEFKDPITSKTCHHSFERDAIMGMIKEQRPPTSARAPPPLDRTATVECPVAGCDRRLHEGDLERNEVVARKIKRLQEAAEGQRIDDDDHIQRVGSGDEDEVEDVDDVDPTGTARSIKSERMRSTVGEDIEDQDED